MRPVLLELEGFASYRTKTTIDFRDTDFFVLVGPTGSGKSTVIDAMVFALYGTVPRWDDRNAVAPALAPTVNRGVVRLIFDVGGERYAATRDIRRSGGRTPTVSIREGRLEQFISPDATGDPDDEVISKATGRGVSAAVEALLGLNFGQFTQSVALPQGEFARFLHATDGERQSILKNLLGYHVYDRIQQAAFSRSSDAESRAEALAGQLQSYADATPEHIDSQREAVESLHALRDHVTTVALPELKLVLEVGDAARSSVQKLTAEREQMLAVARPEDVDSLDAQKRTADAQLKTAESAQQTIEQQDNDIRTSVQALRPRHELEQMLIHWRELGELEARLPGLTETSNAARIALIEATEARDKAEEAARAAQAAAGTTAQLADEHDRQLQTAQTGLGLVEALRAPDGVAEIAESLNHANETLADARRRMTDCEAAQQVVAEQLQALPDSGVLSAADAAAGQVISVISQDTEETEQRAAAKAAAESAHRAADSATDLLATAERALREAEHADQAAVLRTDLHPGDDCPVCGQQVGELPSTTKVDLDAARSAVTAAKTENDQATAAANELDREHQNALAVRRERLKQCESARSTLAGHLVALGMLDSAGVLADPLDADSLTTLLDAATSERELIAKSTQHRGEVEAKRREADTATVEARGVVRSAEASLAAAQQLSLQAQTALHTARDTVRSLDPPRFDDDDVSVAWNQLTTWAGAQLDSLTGQIELLKPQSLAARIAADRTAEELTIAETHSEAARSALTAATVNANQADTEQESARARRDLLTGTLADAPSADACSTELEQVKTLEQQHDTMSTQLLEARAATGRAREAIAAADHAIADSWQQLRRLRDQLAALGAPEIAGKKLQVDWDLLTAWAVAEARTKATTIEAELRALQDAEQRAGTAAESLTAKLAQHDIGVDPETAPAELLTDVPSMVAASVATAESALEHAEERQKQSEKMRTEMKALRESAEVAHLLSNLMRANHFPRWLIASALDALLLDASAILLELSGGQFELTRDERDLLVIDHNDADMSRPVKTLSGGETFQASLSLALALSEQVTALSAEGASKLESIFLDEGFGTLDEATLDVVAGTLENLAASGSRMVGVITHVAALAERIPVRFEVVRDSAGSHIERSLA